MEKHNETHPMRRACDLCHASPCDKLTEQETLIKELHDDVKAMREMLEAWNNAKGFVSTLRLLGVVMRWLAAISAGIAAIFYLRGKL